MAAETFSATYLPVAKRACPCAAALFISPKILLFRLLFDSLLATLRSFVQLSADKMEQSVYHQPPGLRRSTPPGLDAKMDTILREYEVTKEGEQRRHQFLEHLMDHIKTLTVQKDDALRKLQGTERLNVAYQDDLSLANQKIDALQKSMDCDRFVLAVIDGDNALFRDEYIKDGAAGGEQAAQKLYQSIVDHLKNKPYFQLDFKVVIKIFVNLSGLSRAYTEARILPNNIALLPFVQGFNKTHELAEIIDAGNLKEAADTKVKGKPTACSLLHSSHWTRYTDLSVVRQLLEVLPDLLSRTNERSCSQSQSSQHPLQTHSACSIWGQ